jgi:hypothetical protein
LCGTDKAKTIGELSPIISDLPGPGASVPYGFAGMERVGADGGLDSGMEVLGSEAEAAIEHYGVTEANWRDGAATNPHFAAISESPRFVGRAVAALAADPDRARWNGQSLSSGGLAQVYGFTDLDGSRPDAWRYMVEVQDPGKPADATGYR